MPINLELKIKIQSENELVSKILQNGGKFIKNLEQKDTYFEFKEGLLKLREENGLFQLIKYSRNEKSGDRWSDYSIITLKGENVDEYLKELFAVETIVEKNRTLYIYENTRIHLDNVKNLGTFLELETVIEKITSDEGSKEFDNVVKFLGLDITKEIRASYRDLILQAS